MILDSGMAFSIRKYKLGKVRLICFLVSINHLQLLQKLLLVEARYPENCPTPTPHPPIKENSPPSPPG